MLKSVSEKPTIIFLQRTSGVRKTEKERMKSYKTRHVQQVQQLVLPTLYAFCINQKSHFESMLNHQIAAFKMSAIHCTNSLTNNS